MSRAIVHRIPDLDAVASVAASGVPPCSVLLLPMDADEVPASWAGARVLDHPLAGPKAAGAGAASTLAGMPEAAEWDPRIVRAVERSVTGQAPERDFSLQDVLDAVRTALAADGYHTRALDVEVLRVAGAVVRGLAMNHAAERDTESLVGELEVVDLPGYRVAVLPEGRRLWRVAEVLARRGVAASVYRSGRGLGVSRHDGFHAPDLAALRPRLPGWYVHPRGHLASWGGDGPPPAGTPQDQAGLVRLLREAAEEGR